MPLRDLEKDLASKGVPERSIEAASKVLTTIYQWSNKSDGKPIPVSLQNIGGSLASKLNEKIDPLLVLDGIYVLESNGYIAKVWGTYTITDKTVKLFRR